MPGLMISSVLHSPNILYVSSHTHKGKHTHIYTHHPVGDHRSGSFSPLEKKKEGKKEREPLLISQQDDKDQSLCNALTHTLSLNSPGSDHRGDDHAPSYPPSSLEGRTGGRVMETSRCRRHTCQQRPPAPSAALPTLAGAGKRLTDSRETAAKLEQNKKTQRKETTVSVGTRLNL